MLLKELFYTLTTAVIIFTAMELIHRGIVLAYLDFNLILLLWLISGIIIVLIKEKNNEA
jgi:hypothetical protein